MGHHPSRAAPRGSIARGDRFDDLGFAGAAEAREAPDRPRVGRGQLDLCRERDVRRREPLPQRGRGARRADGRRGRTRPPPSAARRGPRAPRRRARASIQGSPAPVARSPADRQPRCSPPSPGRARTRRRRRPRARSGWPPPRRRRGGGAQTGRCRPDARPRPARAARPRSRPTGPRCDTRPRPLARDGGSIDASNRSPWRRPIAPTGASGSKTAPIRTSTHAPNG